MFPFPHWLTDIIAAIFPARTDQDYRQTILCLNIVYTTAYYYSYYFPLVIMWKVSKFYFTRQR